MCKELLVQLRQVLIQNGCRRDRFRVLQNQLIQGALREPATVVSLDQHVALVARRPIPDTLAGDIRCAVSDEAPGRVLTRCLTD